MIATEKLTRYFGDFLAVDSLDLEVQEGEIFGFLGPNGAGKTTTIRMLCALLAPTSGKAWIDGKLLSNKNNDAIRQSVGLLTETPGLYESLTAIDNLIYYARLYGISKTEAAKRTQETLEWLNLWQWRAEPVGTFSRGMKQRLAIGRAMLHSPKILFLDEPTASLDAEASKTIRDAIISLSEAKRTIFLSTHNMPEANQLCNRIAIFKQKLLQLDTPQNLRRNFGLEQKLVLFQLGNQPQNVANEISRLDFVSSVSWQTNKTNYNLAVKLSDPINQNPQITRLLVEAGAEIQYIEEQTASLEEVYLATIATN